MGWQGKGFIILLEQVQIHIHIYIFLHNYSNLCWKLHVLINNFYLAAWNFFVHVSLFVIFFFFTIFMVFYTSVHLHFQSIFLIHSISLFILSTASFLLIIDRKFWQHGLHVAPSSCAGMWWWHRCVLFLSLFTNRRRPNWSMPALRSLNRACSLKRPKLTNSRGS